MKLYMIDAERNITFTEDALEWADWYENSFPIRRVASHNDNGVFVSTVFLGTNHNYLDDGPPLLFETMIFLDKELRQYDPRDWINNYQDRYSTWDEAVEGHKNALMIAMNWYQETVMPKQQLSAE